MGTLEKGAKQVLNNCLKLKKNERFLIITDQETLDVASALRTAAKKKTDHIDFFIIEDHSKRPIKMVPKEMKEVIAYADAGVLAVQGKEGELQSFRKPLLAETDKSKIRFANMVNIDQEIMEQGMNSDYKKIQRFSKKLYEILKNASKIQVKTESGTDLTAEFSPKMKWINADGVIGKKIWSNLPDGEIYTCPHNVEGIFVIDGVLGDYFASKYGLIEHNPVRVEIHNGQAIQVNCDNDELREDFRNYIGMDENASRIGEFALGTNLDLKFLIGKLLQDEKFPGIHIAFGDGYQERTGCPWTSKAHLDGVVKRPTVIVDGQTIMKDGEYLV
jgi:leucyl aminopeptidase (aminopeptidase T)